MSFSSEKGKFDRCFNRLDRPVEESRPDRLPDRPVDPTGFHLWSSCSLICNCNYILFTKLPWPGDSEGTFWSSSQAATCSSVYHTRWKLHTVPLIAERQAGKLWIPMFIVFGLTRPGIEPVSTASVADALSTRPLIGLICFILITIYTSLCPGNTVSF